MFTEYIRHEEHGHSVCRILKGEDAELAARWCVGFKNGVDTEEGKFGKGEEMEALKQQEDMEEDQEQQGKKDEGKEEEENEHEGKEESTAPIFKLNGEKWAMVERSVQARSIPSDFAVVQV